MITPIMLVFQGFAKSKMHDMTWFKTCPTCKTHAKCMNQVFINKRKGVNNCKLYAYLTNLRHASQKIFPTNTSQNILQPLHNNP